MRHSNNSNISVWLDVVPSFKVIEVANRGI